MTSLFTFVRSSISVCYLSGVGLALVEALAVAVIEGNVTY